jgi:hypothetical protein
MNHLLRGCALLIGGLQLTFGAATIGVAAEAAAEQQKNRAIGRNQHPHD